MTVAFPPPSTRRASSWRARLLPASGVALCALGAWLATAACSSSNGDQSCATPNANCPCEGEGVTIDCSEAVGYVPGNDSTQCSSGTRTCTGGRWGACSGMAKSFRSVPPAYAQSAGASTCASNPCDPTCQTYTDNGSDIDAGSVLLTDSGGIAINPGDGSTTGPYGGDGGACTGLECSINSCVGRGGYTATTVTGKVYDPAGLNPLPNVLVYIPNAPLTPFTDGISCTSACPTGSGSPIVSTLTDATGNFTLSGVPSGSGVPLVIQSGKWRRKITLPTVNSCVANSTVGVTGSDGLPLVRFPKNSSEGDIPHIAFVSGGADPFQCVLMKMGLDVSNSSFEIGAPSTGKRVTYWNSPNAPGNDISSALGGPAPKANTLWNSPSTLSTYDAVILACEGSAYNNGATANANIYNYVNGGGRLFLTHYSYTSISVAQPPGSLWPTTSLGSTWGGYSDNYGGTEPVFVDSSFPKGNTFSQWLNAVGASPSPGQLNLLQSRRNFLYTNRAVATDWLYGDVSGTTTLGAANGTNCTSHAQCLSGYCSGLGATVPITNGDFETGDVSGWSIGGPDVEAVNGYAQTGSWSMYLGQWDQPTAVATNTASQTFTAPSLGAPQLSFWYLDNCNSGYGAYANGVLRDNTTGKSSTVLGNSCFYDGTWHQVKTTLTAGHSYTLTFTNYDPTLWNFGIFVDNVTVGGGVCGASSCASSADCPASANGSFCNNAGSCLPPHDYEPLMTFNVPIGAATQCGRVVYSDFHVSAGATNGNPYFPQVCNTGALSSQEKALEYMLFDLTSCLTPDYSPPPAPPKYPTPVTVSRSYSASCPTGQKPVWHFFDYLDHCPTDASGGTQITFKLQTGATPAAVAAYTPVTAATVTTTNTVWGASGNYFDVATIIPPTAQGPLLQVDITLTPSPDGTLTPTLDAWKMAYDCVATE
jgi:hypothetical protein